MHDRQHHLISLAQFGSGLALLLAIAALIWALLNLFDRFGPAADQPAGNSPLATLGSAAGANAQTVELARLPLFGQRQQSSAAPLPSQTKLDLKLRGAITGNAPDQGMAIIEVGGKQRHYRVGDEIGASGNSSDVSLHEVHADHVVLARLGRYERLPLSKPRAAAAGGASRRSLPIIPAQLEGLPVDTAALARSISTMPHFENGQQTGIRLQVGPQHTALLSMLGLRSTDVITSVNGVDLNDPRRQQELMRKLQNARQFEVTVRRDGAAKTLTIDTSQIGNG